MHKISKLDREQRRSAETGSPTPSCHKSKSVPREIYGSGGRISGTIRGRSEPSEFVFHEKTGPGCAACEPSEPTSRTLGRDSILLASEASPHPQHLAEIVSCLRAKRAPIPYAWLRLDSACERSKPPSRPLGKTVVEPWTISEEMILDPDLGCTDDLKSDLRDL